ncbi:Site-specific recombinase XerD [Chryseobacterium wanjuense]|uniref:Site-specific recombinase XerD n=1 Tax=Chryseobacterium wanjuense TaxID=356305 RepID=A0A1I0QGP8_9FLAO|nr:site-specific integrase [Chryseobacterium wanjuense]SEW26017.1 Site-specific recombinase XerD [Chryseobacterium wanjuense]
MVKNRLTFFLKSPKKKGDMLRAVHVRVKIGGIPMETSTKKKWDVRRWDQKVQRAIGTKEDARTLNFYLDSVVNKVSNFITKEENLNKIITSRCVINYINGNDESTVKVLEEFQKHNDEMYALVRNKGKKSKEIDNEQDDNKGFDLDTWKRYVTARSHVQEFIQFKYKRDDLEFRELNYEFVKDYDFYLKTVRNCANNTTLKYISNFKKIVRIAIKKGIIPGDPFVQFKGKKTKILNRPLTWAELRSLENKQFSTDRLSRVRDIFVFQCYTGLAYIDIFRLKRTDIKEGIDGKLWIMNRRKKCRVNTDIPLLPKALELMDKYKDDPECSPRGSILPVKSNQNMNGYLKEIAALCGINSKLSTHKARHTFASTVTLNNGVPINVVKELLGHSSVKQTEHYATTTQESINKEMTVLKQKLSTENADEEDIDTLFQNLEKEFKELKKDQSIIGKDRVKVGLYSLQQKITKLRASMDK